MNGQSGCPEAIRLGGNLGAITTQIGKAEVVGKDEDDIGFGRGSGQRQGGREGQEEESA
jgi:hypothetical protein